MRSRRRCILHVLAILLTFVAVFSVSPRRAGAECPTVESLQDGVRKVLPPNVEITGVSESSVMGLCEVQVRLQGQTRVLYTDPRGEYLFLGQLVESATGRNITREATEALNRLSSEELKQLESLTAFTAGNGGKVVYFATDPQCPYCKKGDEILKSLVDSGEITVRYLLLPLKSHKGAREQCIATLCDGKGLEGFRSGYQSSNQCPEGGKKVDDTIAFLGKKGISSTPTYIFPDGAQHSGMLQADALRQRLGIPVPEAKSGQK